MRTRKPAWISVVMLLAAVAVLFPARAGATAPAASSAAPVAQGSCQTFPETGKTVSQPFLDYWQTHGGLAQQGFPIEETGMEQSPTDGKGYRVQYFERAVFELHPENNPPYNVLLSLLGRFRYDAKYPGGAPNQQPNTDPGSRLFPETGKRVGGKFLVYWQSHGGLAQQGFPISDEFTEVSELDGKPYTVQYFERAVFELHPENAPPYDVLLSQLGSFRYHELYPNGWSQALLVANDCTAPPPTHDSDGDGIPDNADKCPQQPETANGVFDSDGCPDTVQDLINFARDDINSFWQQTFTASDLDYIPPTQFKAYTQRISTPCGRAMLDNAFYCERDHAIYYDLNFLARQLQTDGDFAPVTIIAHEWGHLVQADLGILDSSRYTIDIELQADCFAGAYAKHAGEEGLLEEGDLDEGVNNLYKAGDESDLPWFAAGAHGQPDQRVGAFQLGLDNGADKCLQ
jgi:predicted metalloprotease